MTGRALRVAPRSTLTSMRLPLSGTPAGASRISATCPTPCSPIAVRTSSTLASPELLDTTTVATVDGQIAGFIVTNRDEIEQLYVASDHRGSSIAAALLEHGEQVISAEHELAFLAVVDANSRARRFYERNGWHDAGPFDYLAWTPDGAPASVPCRRYEKLLRVHE